MPGVAAICASEPSQPLPSVYEPSLCIVVQGRKQTRLVDEIYVYDPLNYLVVSVTLPMVGQVIEATRQRPYLSLRINVDRKLLSELLLQADATTRRRPGADRGLYVTRADPEFLDAIVRLVRLLDRPQEASVLAPLVLREIQFRALNGELGWRLRELCVLDSQSQRIAHSIDLIRTRFAESLRIEDLASAVHMSASSFHHRFKEVTAMSPLQFQKQLRLHEARRLMLADGSTLRRLLTASVMKARRNSAASTAACSAPHPAARSARCEPMALARSRPITDDRRRIAGVRSGSPTRSTIAPCRRKSPV